MSDNAQTPVLFQLEKIYVKDSSFEVPGAPQVFLEQKAPEVGVQLHVGHAAIDREQGLYESVLAITVTARAGERNVFLVEVQQAGLFRIRGLPEDEIVKALEIACPTVLLPFARQIVNSLVESGGFPQLLLAPINFEALYQQKRQPPAQPAAASH